ncbi:hypothetical protein SDC9_78608 [bioreactor metagenome]|uniref:Uncharacterized protein n=1 Tax=bioreactor metagenome TaxID=1076179 RepID=A0A644YTY5_9ZZZZ
MVLVLTSAVSVSAAHVALILRWVRNTESYMAGIASLNNSWKANKFKIAVEIVRTIHFDKKVMHLLQYSLA